MTVGAVGTPSDGTPVEMKVAALTIDPFTNMPILVLKDLKGRNPVPIWIGRSEASAIAAELEKVELARPMTHDLMKVMLGAVGVAVTRVEVTDLRENTFYATIVLCREGKTFVIDARPSDAIALALRASCSIRVARKVNEKSRSLDLRSLDRDGAAGPVDPETYRHFLETLSEDAFGKWKM
ncbi:MAG: bifunctional nuclease family protein [Deltaproteobacteria bacterium]|nr:bifunctional nuclease family protein [Deltaproteobacteria bacterium]